MDKKTYNIGQYEIHPTTPAELQYSISTNFSIAGELLETDPAGVLDELRSKVIDAVRYYFDHQ